MGKRNIWLRRISQILFLGLWIFLFWKTAHTHFSPLPPDLFLSTDPLAAALAMAASRVWVPSMLQGLILIVATLVLGRFFCGWICPLGTVFDAVGRVWRGKKTKTLENDHNWRRVKYYILAAMAVAALTGSQLVYWGDPLVISFRAVATGLVPSTDGETAFLALTILLVLIGLCGVTHRFWCRYLCPLGAFYGALARFSIFRRRLKGCDRCKSLDELQCQSECSMGVSSSKQGNPEECIRCMSCQANCPSCAPKFVPTIPLPSRRENLMDLDRRTFVMSLGTGAVLGVAATKANAGLDASPWRVVRPPMVSDEEAFLSLCLRCDQCVRSCPTGTLQPLILEAGFSGIWTPAVTPRVGGCQDDCNACSQACSTGAIPAFGPKREEKWSVKMGQVLFEPNLCITYADDAVKPCLKCVEACPNKAIVMDLEAKITRPLKIIRDRCIGCGLCETACRKMVIGRPALTLTANGAGNPVVLVVDPKPKIPGHEEAHAKEDEEKK